jgi:hypothetical protein
MTRSIIPGIRHKLQGEGIKTSGISFLFLSSSRRRRRISNGTCLEFKMSHMMSGKNDIYKNRLPLNIGFLWACWHRTTIDVKILYIIFTPNDTTLSCCPTNIRTIGTILLGVFGGITTRPHTFLPGNVISGSF